MPVAASAAGSWTRVAPHVVGVKPQLAFFEALGADGLRAFEDVCAYARSAGLVVVADAKRGDIGSTSRAYATAYLEPRSGGPPVADADDGQSVPSAAIPSSRSSAPAGATAAESSAWSRPPTKAAPTSRT